MVFNPAVVFEPAMVFEPVGQQVPRLVHSMSQRGEGKEEVPGGGLAYVLALCRRASSYYDNCWAAISPACSMAFLSEFSRAAPRLFHVSICGELFGQRASRLSPPSVRLAAVVKQSLQNHAARIHNMITLVPCRLSKGAQPSRITGTNRVDGHV